MAKLTLTALTSAYQAVAQLNANNALIEAAIENTISRDGTTPNNMNGQLDMNSNRITNLPTAVSNAEPVTLGQANILAGTTNPLTQETVGAALWPQTAAEAAATVTPAEFENAEGEWDRYTTPATDIPLVYSQATAPRINRQNYLDGDWVVLGDPNTSSFGTDADAINTALLLAEDLGKGVLFSGGWTGLTPTTDPDALGRTACIYLPGGVSFIGMDKVNSSLALANGANAQMIVLRNPVSDNFHQTVGGFVVNGNKSNQTGNGGGHMVDIDPTTAQLQYFLGQDLRIRNCFGGSLHVGGDMQESMWNNIWSHGSGATGSGPTGAAIYFGAADLIVSNIASGLSDGFGVAISGAGIYTNMKSWRAGESDTANGSGFRCSMGVGGLMFTGWSQDCAKHGMLVFSSSSGYGDQIRLFSDSCGGAGLQLGNNRNYGQYHVTAIDRSGGSYTHTFAIDINGANNDNNRIVADGDGTVAVIDSSSPNIDGNTLVVAGEQRMEVVTATNVITMIENGKTFYLDSAGGFTSTLPAPLGGLKFTFIIKTAPTTAYIITTSSGADILFGTFRDIVGELTYFSAQDTLNFVASTALVGDRLEIESDGTNWYCTAKSGANGGITVSVT